MLSFLSLLLLSACGTIKLKDGPVCGDMGPLGATCDNVFKDKPKDLDKPTWDKVRFGQLCMGSALFTNWKGALIKFCNDTKRCTFEEEEAVEQVGKKVDKINHRKGNRIQRAYGVSEQAIVNSLKEEVEEVEAE